MMMTGRQVRRISAQIRFQLLEYWPKKLYTARVIGHFSEEFRKYRGITNSFQVFRKQSTAAVTILDFIIGITILKDNFQGPQPSSTAATSRSTGTLDTKPYRRKTENGSCIAT